MYFIDDMMNACMHVFMKDIYNEHLNNYDLLKTNNIKENIKEKKNGLRVIKHTDNLQAKDGWQR